MASELKQRARRFPKEPGVYLMKDGRGEVIYIGKAKDLRARVLNYFTGADERAQVKFLLQKVERIEPIVTRSEEQAFILERDLISKHKPRYNIRLKDDKAYLSIKIDLNQPWPRLELVRKISSDGARYFGPYTFSYEMRNLLEVIKRAVPLRTCSDTVFYNRTRPCLEYQIKRCAGPCCLPVDREVYLEWVKQAISILEGKSEALSKKLEAQMESASGRLQFEEAAVLRDRIQALRNAKTNQEMISSDLEDRDYFSHSREGKLASVSVLRTRFGRIADTANFAFNDVVVSDQELLSSVIGQFYDEARGFPREIIVPYVLSDSELLETVLSRRAGFAVSLVVPERGVKHRLLKLAEVNARQNFSMNFEEEANAALAVKELALKLKLKQIPRKIECIDVSNLQGSDIVGAVISFYDGKPEKESYKRYNISFSGKPDDFAAIHEVVSRRLQAGLQDGDLPDLLVIDGGAGQLAKALQVRDALKINIEIIALAKGRAERSGETSRKAAASKPERVFVEESSVPIALASEDIATLFIQRVRDEAHRFVLSFHRQKRSKRALRSVLDTISGIGPDRRARLLRAFGSVDAMKDAPLEDLAKAGRMSKLLAEKVKKRLN
ncbi:MAG: excinuclease ABC subunit C [Proteobacteria bacterium]|nr:MAG: excinuclease ABC subunit C [Pseudomonadota bacterium]